MRFLSLFLSLPSFSPTVSNSKLNKYRIRHCGPNSFGLCTFREISNSSNFDSHKKTYAIKHDRQTDENDDTKKKKNHQHGLYHRVMEGHRRNNHRSRSETTCLERYPSNVVRNRKRLEEHKTRLQELERSCRRKHSLECGSV